MSVEKSSFSLVIITSSRLLLLLLLYVCMSLVGKKGQREKEKGGREKEIKIEIITLNLNFFS